MKKILLIFLLNTSMIFSQNIHVPIDTIVKTNHETIIKGEKINIGQRRGVHKGRGGNVGQRA